jgi:hypothetical protein
LPRIGRASAEASSGAEIAHARTVSEVLKSFAMSPRETARIVTGNVVANIPVSATRSTHRG